MLTLSNNSRIGMRSKQSGVVLIITLVILVAMTLAAISLVRSVDTTNIIAGNLAFKQSATQSGDAGVDDALNVLIPSLIANGQLNANSCPAGLGYMSWHQPNLDPPNQTWDAFWASMGNCPKTLAQDASGNTVNAAGQIVALSSTVKYVMEAMCSQNGQTGVCSTPPPSALVSCVGNDLGNANQKCTASGQSYFRVTTRVEGPRNSISYIQTFIAM